MLWGPSRHLGSLTAANWVSFDFNVSYSSCWGYSLINTFKLKKSWMDRGALPSVGSAFMPARGFYVAIHTLHFWMHFIKQEQQFWKRHSSKNITIICHIILHITRGADRTRNLRPNKRSWWTPHHAFWTTLFFRILPLRWGSPNASTEVVHSPRSWSHLHFDTRNI